MTHFLKPNDPEFEVLQDIVTYKHTKLQKALTKNESSRLKNSFFFFLLLAAIT